MIKLKHIYKSYSLGDEQVDVLHDINLHVKPKEFVSILGPSGSGKSTLMNIIGCLDIPDSGDYILDGEYVDNCTAVSYTHLTKQSTVYACRLIGFRCEQYCDYYFHSSQPQA